MTTHLYLIRHAEPNYNNHDDTLRELTPKGLQDSQSLVKLFQGISIDSFYSSPYKRAIDTIAPLAKDRKATIQLVEELRERKITDQWIEDFTGFTEKQWADFSYHLPGGESLQQVQARNLLALTKILTEHNQQTIVIGTHGTALSTILHAYNPTFGIADFNSFKDIFPYIIQLEFDCLTLVSSRVISIT